MRPITTCPLFRLLRFVMCSYAVRDSRNNPGSTNYTYFFNVCDNVNYLYYPECAATVPGAGAIFSIVWHLLAAIHMPAPQSLAAIHTPNPPSYLQATRSRSSTHRRPRSSTPTSPFPRGTSATGWAGPCRRPPWRGGCMVRWRCGAGAGVMRLHATCGECVGVQTKPTPARGCGCSTRAVTAAR